MHLINCINKIDWSHFLMMGRGMVLGEVISMISHARFPFHLKLSLITTVLYPIKSHVHGARFLRLDHFVDDAIRSGVVCDERGGLGLWPSHFT